MRSLRALLEARLRARPRLRLPDRRRLVRLPAHPRPRARPDARSRRSCSSGTSPRRRRSPALCSSAAGVVLVRGPEGHGDAKAVLVVLTIAASIAAYTTIDRAGIQPRRGVHLLRPRPRRPVPRLSAARRARGDAARARDPDDRRCRSGGRLVPARTARTPARRRRAGARRALVVDRDRNPACRALPVGERLAGKDRGLARRVREASRCSRCRPQPQPASAEAVRAREPGDEETDEQRRGQADDVQVVALDPLDSDAPSPWIA